MNLNATLAPAGSVATAAASVEPQSSSQSPSSQLIERTALLSSPPDESPSNEPPVASSSTAPAPEVLVNGKRKSRTTESSSKRYKTSSSADGLNRGGSSSKEKDYSPPSARLADLGGVQECVEKILELVAMPIAHPEVYIHTGVQPPRGVLLYGPPGCGKTLLAHAIAGVGASQLIWLDPIIETEMRTSSKGTRCTFH